jgi:hypothetical protein
MSTASTAFSPEHAELEVTLLNGEIIGIPLRGMEPDILVASIFRQGFIRATDGTFHAASHIKSCTIGGNKK